MESRYSKVPTEKLIRDRSISLVLQTIAGVIALAFVILSGIEGLLSALVIFAVSSLNLWNLISMNAELKKRQYSDKEMQDGKNSAKKVLAVIASISFIILIIVYLLAGGYKNNKNKCTICGDTASNEFQGARYCKNHYKDAIYWTLDNVNNK